MAVGKLNEIECSQTIGLSSHNKQDEQAQEGRRGRKEMEKLETIRFINLGYSFPLRKAEKRSSVLTYRYYSDSC